AGEKFDGHTELLAHYFEIRKEKVGMLLTGGSLKVFLATRHLSLKNALKKITLPYLSQQVELCAAGLNASLGIKKPHLALAALNPHAGEAGAFGNEEKKVLQPLIKKFKANKNFKLSGPYPADTLFHFAAQGLYDAVLCLYHDQGLIPLK